MSPSADVIVKMESPAAVVAITAKHDKKYLESIIRIGYVQKKKMTNNFQKQETNDKI